jgi:hypothetical protein
MATPTGGASLEKKLMNSPVETRTFEKGKIELTTFKNGTAIGRIRLEPVVGIDFTGLRDYAKEGEPQQQV